MRRLSMALAVFAMLAIGLAACGGKDSESGEAPAADVTAAAEPSPEPTVAAEPAQTEAAAEAARMILAAVQAQRGGALCPLLSTAALEELSSRGPGAHDIAALCRDDPAELFDVDRPHQTVLEQLETVLPYLYDGKRGIRQDSDPQPLDKVRRLLAALPVTVQPLDPEGTQLVAFGLAPTTGLALVDEGGWKLATFSAPSETQNVLAAVERPSNGLGACLRQQMGGALEDIEALQSGGMELVLDEERPSEPSPRAKVYLFNSEQEVLGRIADGALKGKIRIFGFAASAGAVVYTTAAPETNSYVQPDAEDMRMPRAVPRAVEACVEELELGDSRERRIDLGD